MLSRFKYKSILYIVSTLIFIIPGFYSASAVDFYVSMYGKDTNPGTEGQPFATVEAARDAIWEIKQRDGQLNGITNVYIQPGTYTLKKSFTLNQQDTGAELTPIIYRAVTPGQTIITGGISLQTKDFKPVTDIQTLNRIVNLNAQKHILQLDLTAYGINQINPILPRGFQAPIKPAPIELFFNKQPMTIARWPNSDNFTTVKNLIPQENEQVAFTYADDDEDRPSHWTQAKDLWVYGYWKYDWADESLPVSAINTENKQITLPYQPHYPVTAGARYYVENLLEEIDTPGEYFIDRENKILYFYPPQPLDKQNTTTIELSLLDQPLFDLNDVSYLDFRNLVFETSRADGVNITNGKMVRFAGCTFRNLGNLAVKILDGEAHFILSCDIYNTGEGGISLTGGDRKTLTPAKLRATNNHIYNFSRRTATYRPAIAMQGVGNHASHNLIHDGPHSAIIFWGNDHIIEYNEIHNVLKLTGDGGAVYTGRDWSARGNIIRNNYFHDITGISKWENAVYIDDQTCETYITGNVFSNCHWGMLIGGGRDNLIENNIFSNCKLAMHIDARGLGWAKQALGEILPQRLNAVPYTQEPWITRYPKLVNILNDDPMTPKGNIIRKNILFKSGTIYDDLAKPVIEYGTIENNYETSDNPGFTDLPNLNFQLKSDSIIWQKIGGFENINFDKMGLYLNEYRPSIN